MICALVSQAISTSITLATKATSNASRHDCHLHFLCTAIMAAIFNFESLLLVILLLICTFTYLRAMFPRLIDRRKEGVLGLGFKFARIGERLSPYISICCVIMAVRLLI